MRIDGWHWGISPYRQALSVKEGENPPIEDDAIQDKIDELLDQGHKLEFWRYNWEGKQWHATEVDTSGENWEPTDRTRIVLDEEVSR